MLTKLKNYYNTTTPQQVVEELEKLGVEFIDIPHYSYIPLKSTDYNTFKKVIDFCINFCIERGQPLWIVRFAYFHLGKKCYSGLRLSGSELQTAFFSDIPDYQHANIIDLTNCNFSVDSHRSISPQGNS